MGKYLKCKPWVPRYLTHALFNYYISYFVKFLLLVELNISGLNGLGCETLSFNGGEYPPAGELLGLEPRECRRAEFHSNHGPRPLSRV